MRAREITGNDKEKCNVTVYASRTSLMEWIKYRHPFARFYRTIASTSLYSIRRIRFSSLFQSFLLTTQKTFSFELRKFKFRRCSSSIAFENNN